MENRFPTKNKAFLDTSFSLALSIRSDVNHNRAALLSAELARSGTRVFTTQAIILESGNAFARARYRSSAVSIISGLREEPNTTIIPVSNQLIERAFELFSSRMDKQWGLVDCISFTVMREKRIEAALTADEHFVQAGFRALLREGIV